MVAGSGYYCTIADRSIDRYWWWFSGGSIYLHFVLIFDLKIES